MARFQVEVKVVKYDTYTVEVEADDPSEAEDRAQGEWRENVSESFQVDKPDGWEILDCTQLTFECQECRSAISEAQYRAQDELCSACYRKQVQEDIDYWNETPERIHTASMHTMAVAVADGREVFDVCSRRQWRVKQAEVFRARKGVGL